MIFVVLVLLLIVIASALYSLNRWLLTYINPCIYPNNIWYRHHLERNFDAIILGNGIDRWNYPDNQWGGGNTLFNLALRNQTLERDFKVLCQNFSILRHSGFAIFPLDCLDYYVRSDVRDKRPYIYTNFGYTLSLKRRVQSFKKLCKYYPFIMATPKDIYALIRHFLKGDEQYYSDVQSIGRISSNCHNSFDFRQIIKKIYAFCTERDIIPLFVFSPMRADLKNEITGNAAHNMMSILQEEKCNFIDLYSDTLDSTLFEKDGLRLTGTGKDFLTDVLVTILNRGLCERPSQ